MNLFRKQLQPGQRVFRPFVLVVVITVVVYAFWMNNQKRLDAIIAQGLCTDQTGQLAVRDKEALLAHLKLFKPAFGVPLEVNILTRPPALTKNDTSRIYLDILPGQRKAMLTLPPLVRRAAEPEFAGTIETMFDEAFASGDWRPALLPAVVAIKNKLTELNR